MSHGFCIRARSAVHAKLYVLTFILSSLLCVSACSDGGAADNPQGDAGTDISDAGPLDGDAHTIGDLGAGLSTLAGDSVAGLVDGPRDVSLFNNPVNVAVGVNDKIYVADFDNGAIREVTGVGETTTLVRQAGFSRPFGMAFTPAGSFYVQTDHNTAGELTGALWRIALDTGVATLLEEGVGRTRGLASLSDGRLVLVDPFASTLRLYDPDSGSMTALAGQANSPGFADGVGAAARFERPMDVVVTDSDEIYVADSGNHRIRHVTLAGVVSTVAGTGVKASMDGASLSASFDTPIGLAIDDDTLFVSEFDSGLLRMVESGSVATIAGSTQGFLDNSDPLLGKLYVCEGLAFAAPYLYIADGNGGTDAPFHRVRRLDMSE